MGMILPKYLNFLKQNMSEKFCLLEFLHQDFLQLKVQNKGHKNASEVCFLLCSVWQFFAINSLFFNAL